MSSESRIVVIGLGNRFYGDDQVGCHVAQSIAKLGSKNVAALENIADNAALIESWHKNDRVYIIDATSSGSSPGEIRRFNAVSEKIPEEIFARYSTHSLNLTTAFDLAGILDKLPVSLVVFGIEGESFEAGAALTPEVGLAAERVTKIICAEISNLQSHKKRMADNA